MKKPFILLISFLILQVALLAQSKEFQITSKTTFRDEAGELVSFEKFIELTSGDGYEMQPEFDEDGNLQAINIIKSSVAPVQLQTSQFFNPTELIDHAPPNFSGTAINGQQYISENLRGKVVVIKFWFIACPPCIQEMPELNQLVNDYRGQGVEFLGFSLDSKEEIQQFLQRRAFNYQLIPSGRPVAQSFNVMGYPTHLVINKNGIVEAVYMGVNTRIKEKLSRAIDFALGKEMAVANAIPANQNTPLPPPELGEEVVVTPNSIIKNDKGEVLSFEAFAALMNTNRFTLLKKRETDGSEFILVKEVSN